jgi:hypothetical protein
LRLVSACLDNLLAVFTDSHGSGLATDGMAPRIDKKGLTIVLRVILAALILDPTYYSTESDSPASGADIVKQLNILLIKILEHSDRDVLYACLLGKLESACTFLMTCEAKAVSSDGNQAASTAGSPCFLHASVHEYAAAGRKQLLDADYKFIELLMKCIWRLTRSLPDHITAEQLNVRDLVRACNAFLLATSPYQWKCRVTLAKPLADMPLRTIKTILHELVVALPEQVLMQHVARALGSDWEKSMVAGYLRFMIEKKAEKPDSIASANTQNSPPYRTSQSSAENRSFDTAASGPVRCPASPQLAVRAPTATVPAPASVPLPARDADNPEAYQSKLSEIKSLFLRSRHGTSDAVSSTASARSSSGREATIDYLAGSTSTVIEPVHFASSISPLQKENQECHKQLRGIDIKSLDAQPPADFSNRPPYHTSSTSESGLTASEAEPTPPSATTGTARITPASVSSLKERLAKIRAAEASR